MAEIGGMRQTQDPLEKRRVVEEIFIPADALRAAFAWLAGAEHPARCEQDALPASSVVDKSIGAEHAGKALSERQVVEDCVVLDFVGM